MASEPHAEQDEGLPVLSVTTDYIQDTGDPEPYLRQISESGFTHIHWCHQWCTDFVYSNAEIEWIADRLQVYNLSVLDIHASKGIEKNWSSNKEHERRAGVALVENRIRMARQLQSDVIVMHFPETDTERDSLDQLHRSLDALEPVARQHGVRIAVENSKSNYATIDGLLADRHPEFLGVCYDSGHGNLGDQTGLNWLSGTKDRLICVHLHDNDGTADQHAPLFSGTVDWERLAKILAESSYNKCVSQELSMKHSGRGIEDAPTFLSEAIQNGTTLTRMIEAYRPGSG